MHTIVNILAIGVVLAAAFTLATMAAPPAGSAQPGGEDLTKLAASNNAFALDIYAQVKDGDKNAFISPYSISSALAMTWAGAKGATAEEMAKALHLDWPADRVHAAFHQLTTDLNAGKQQGTLLVANALWGQQGFAFKPDYLQLVENSYGGKLATLDFKGAADDSRKTINKWVEEQTKEKIKDLIPPGLVNSLTRLVLTNAVYFKASWLHTFNKSRTKKEDFTLADGSKTTAEMMHQQERFNYFEGDGFQVLEMTYTGPSTSMVILLPRKADGLAAFEKQLNAKRLNDWISKMKGAKVEVSLPKFRIESKFELAAPLKKLGMVKAFSDDSDFSGMTDVERLEISEVIHQTFVNVDEEGTEAAAATAVVMRAGSAVQPEEPKEFRADHPFMFLIRDRKSGTILFLGRVMDPVAKAAG